MRIRYKYYLSSSNILDSEIWDCPDELALIMINEHGFEEVSDLEMEDAQRNPGLAQQLYLEKIIQNHK